MAEAAAWSDLTGTNREDKPWLNGLPGPIFVSDMSDALSAAISFDFLEAEVISTVTTPMGHRLSRVATEGRGLIAGGGGIGNSPPTAAHRPMMNCRFAPAIPWPDHTKDNARLLPAIFQIDPDNLFGPVLDAVVAHVIYGRRREPPHNVSIVAVLRVLTLSPRPPRARHSRLAGSLASRVFGVRGLIWHPAAVFAVAKSLDLPPLHY